MFVCVVCLFVFRWLITTAVGAYEQGSVASLSLFIYARKSFPCPSPSTDEVVDVIISLSQPSVSSSSSPLPSLSFPLCPCLSVCPYQRACCQSWGKEGVNGGEGRKIISIQNSLRNPPASPPVKNKPTLTRSRLRLHYITGVSGSAWYEPLDLWWGYFHMGLTWQCLFPLSAFSVWPWIKWIFYFQQENANRKNLWVVWSIFVFHSQGCGFVFGRVLLCLSYV